MAKEPSELKAKLKKADPMVRDYVSVLEARNAKRQRQILQLEADKVELDGRIKALEKQLKEKKIDIRYNLPSDWAERQRRAKQRTEPEPFTVHAAPEKK